MIPSSFETSSAPASRAEALEHIGDGAGRAEISAVLGEEVADVRGGAVLVVGEDFDEDGDSAGAVAFIVQFLVGRRAELAGALLDGALDVVLRHVRAAGLEDRGAEAGVRGGIAAAHARGNRDFLDEFGKRLSALRVGESLGVLNRRPFTMS